jgi:hypothetical protein
MRRAIIDCTPETNVLCLRDVRKAPRANATGKAGSDVRRKVRSREGTATPRSCCSYSNGTTHSSTLRVRSAITSIGFVDVRKGHGALCSSPKVRAWESVAADAGACRRLRFGVSVAWQYRLQSEQHRAQEDRESEGEARAVVEDRVGCNVERRVARL